MAKIKRPSLAIGWGAFSWYPQCLCEEVIHYDLPLYHTAVFAVCDAECRHHCQVNGSPVSYQLHYSYMRYILPQRYKKYRIRQNIVSYILPILIILTNLGRIYLRC